MSSSPNLVEVEGELELEPKANTNQASTSLAEMKRESLVPETVPFVSKTFYKPEVEPINLFELLDQVQTLSFGHKDIDNLLGGGLLTKTVTQIFGKSSSGKTQLGLQLALQTNLPLELGGLNKACLYISTEQEFPILRYQQIYESIDRKHNYVLETNFKRSKLFQNTTSTLYDLNEKLDTTIPSLLSKGEIGCVIVDSFGGLMRDVTYLDQEIATQVLQKFQALAFKFDLVIVLINQVSEIFKVKEKSNESARVKKESSEESIEVEESYPTSSDEEEDIDFAVGPIFLLGEKVKPTFHPNVMHLSNLTLYCKRKPNLKQSRSLILVGDTSRLGEARFRIDANGIGTVIEEEEEEEMEE